MKGRDPQIMVKTAAAVSLLALAFLAVAWHATKAGERSVLSGDSFVDSFLRASKNSMLARRGKVKAWHKQIEKGGLFARMHALERHDKAAKKAWRNKALASITEPSSKDMIKQLESMQARYPLSTGTKQRFVVWTRKLDASFHLFSRK